MFMYPIEVLIEEIKTELYYLNKTSNDIEDLLHIVASREPNNIEKAAASQYLSQFYNGIENILKRILKYKQIPLPKTGSWHSDLLTIFRINDEDALIPIIDDEKFRLLAAYMKIRHIIRQGYQYNLDWNKVLIALEHVSGFLDDFESLILKYIFSIK